MNRTKAEHYNKRLNEIVEPRIEQLKKAAETARAILAALDEKIEIDCCGLEEWQIINLIAKEIYKRY